MAKSRPPPKAEKPAAGAMQQRGYSAQAQGPSAQRNAAQPIGQPQSRAAQADSRDKNLGPASADPSAGAMQQLGTSDQGPSAQRNAAKQTGHNTTSTSSGSPSTQYPALDAEDIDRIMAKTWRLADFMADTKEAWVAAKKEVMKNRSLLPSWDHDFWEAWTDKFYGIVQRSATSMTHGEETAEQIERNILAAHPARKVHQEIVLLLNQAILDYIAGVMADKSSSTSRGTASGSLKSSNLDKGVEKMIKELTPAGKAAVREFLGSYDMDLIRIKKVEKDSYEAMYDAREQSSHKASKLVDCHSIQQVIINGDPAYQNDEKDKFSVITHTFPRTLKPLASKNSNTLAKQLNALDENVHCPDPEAFPLQNQTWRVYHDVRKHQLISEYLPIYRNNQGTHLANCAEFALYIFSQGRPMRIWTASGHGAEKLGFAKDYKSPLGGCMFTMEEADVYMFTEREHALWASRNNPPHNVLVADAEFNVRRPATSLARWLRDMGLKSKNSEIYIDVQKTERPDDKAAAVPMMVKDAIKAFERSRNNKPISLANAPLNLLNISDASRNQWVEGMAKEYTLLGDICHDIDTKIYSDMKDPNGKMAMGKPVVVAKSNSDMTACGQFRICAQRGAVSRWHQDQCGVNTFVTLEANTDDPNETNEDVVKYWPSMPMKHLSPVDQKEMLEEYAVMGECWRPRAKGGIPVITILLGQMLIQAPGNIHGPITLTDCFFVGGMAWKPADLKEHLKAWKFSSTNSDWVSNEEVPRQAQEFVQHLKLLVEANPTGYGYASNSAEDLADFYEAIREIYSCAGKCSCKGACSSNADCECQLRNVNCGIHCGGADAAKTFEMGKSCKSWKVKPVDSPFEEASKGKKKSSTNGRQKKNEPASKQAKNAVDIPEPTRALEPEPKPKMGEKRRRRGDPDSEESAVEETPPPKKRRGLMTGHDKKSLEKRKQSPPQANISVAGSQEVPGHRSISPENSTPAELAPARMDSNKASAPLKVGIAKISPMKPLGKVKPSGTGRYETHPGHAPIQLFNSDDELETFEDEEVLIPRSSAAQKRSRANSGYEESDVENSPAAKKHKMDAKGRHQVLSDKSSNTAPEPKPTTPSSGAVARNPFRNSFGRSPKMGTGVGHSMGSGGRSMGSSAPLMGSSAPLMGGSAPIIGSIAPSMGHGDSSIGISRPFMGISAPLMSSEPPESPFAAFARSAPPLESFAVPSGTHNVPAPASQPLSTSAPPAQRAPLKIRFKVKATAAPAASPPPAPKVKNSRVKKEKPKARPLSAPQIAAPAPRRSRRGEKDSDGNSKVQHIELNSWKGGEVATAAPPGNKVSVAKIVKGKRVDTEQDVANEQNVATEQDVVMTNTPESDSELSEVDDLRLA